MKIAQLVGREIYDSRGEPTLACQLTLENGLQVMSMVPAGKSRGAAEALELRDGGDRLGGKGVHKAMKMIAETIAPHLIDVPLSPLEMDEMLINLDGTPNKSKLGANTTLAVSMALFKAKAALEGVELFELLARMSGNQDVNMPVPMFNMINGGAHADNNLAVQEFMVVPVGAESFRQAFELGTRVFHELKRSLSKAGKSTNVGDEGGFAPDFEDEQEAINMLVEAIATVDADGEGLFAVALDIAASQFYDPKKKIYRWHGDQLTTDELIEWYQMLCTYYPIYSIEDGLTEDDWDGWKKLTETLGSTTQLVGDDLFATNTARIKQGIEHGAGNAVLIKPNQIGTISQTLDAIRLCKEQDLAPVISHRSGETEDTFIADLAVGTSAGQIKAGGCCRSERVAKYNRLLIIEDVLTESLFSIE